MVLPYVLEKYLPRLPEHPIRCHDLSLVYRYQILRVPGRGPFHDLFRHLYQRSSLFVPAPLSRPDEPFDLSRRGHECPSHSHVASLPSSALQRSLEYHPVNSVLRQAKTIKMT